MNYKYIKLVITDIDGVWTDGGMYYDNQGNEFKKFSVYDGWGVRFLRDRQIHLAIMTGETTDIVERRAKKLGIEYLFQGAKNKLALAKDLSKKLGITLQEVAFIGDELNDIELLREVGLSACPAQASSYIQKEVDLVLQTKGGDGAFKEFAWIITDGAKTTLNDYKLIH